MRPSMDDDEFINLLQGSDPVKVELNRLENEESERYKSLIRQHMDLNTIQSRLNKGVYTDCTSQFFRDLLLLFNNAVVFFLKTWPEHIAAQELRSIVLKEMKDRLPKPQQPMINNTVKSKLSKLESDGSVKIRRGGKKEKGEDEEKEKANNEKINGGGFVKVEDKGVRKSRTKESAGKRGLRTSNKNAETTTLHYGRNELSSHDGLEVEKKLENVKKKQGVAARFLKSLKVKEESSDDSNDSMVEEDEKNPMKTERKKPGERKERAKRSSAGSGGRRGGKRNQESGGRGRRGRGGGGRPPRRPGSARSGRGNRGRKNGEADDEVGSAGRPRKRTRK